MGSLSAQPNAAVPRGIYAPTITFFKNDAAQSLDLDRQAQHVNFMLDAGVHGIVVHGTTGEAVLLSHEERNAVTKLVADQRSSTHPQTTIVVGCSGQSTRETIQLCEDAKSNGADFALVLPPSYWVKAMNPEAIEEFYTEVADNAPLPIIIYSFPAVVGGIDMDSDLLARLGKHRNISGVKLTCGSASKLTRLTALYHESEFSVFGGSSDWLLPGLISKSCGAVTGLANTHPRACVKLFDLFEAGRLAEAVELQGQISLAEWGMGKTGMAGTKYAVQWANGLDEVLPRRPLRPVDKETREWIEKTMGPLSVLEKKLASAKS